MVLTGHAVCWTAGDLRQPLPLPKKEIRFVEQKVKAACNRRARMREANERQVFRDTARTDNMASDWQQPCIEVYEQLLEVTLSATRSLGDHSRGVVIW